MTNTDNIKVLGLIMRPEDIHAFVGRILGQVEERRPELEKAVAEMKRDDDDQRYTFKAEVVNTWPAVDVTCYLTRRQYEMPENIYPVSIGYLHLVEIGIAGTRLVICRWSRNDLELRYDGGPYQVAMPLDILWASPRDPRVELLMRMWRHLGTDYHDLNNKHEAMLQQIAERG